MQSLNVLTTVQYNNKSTIEITPIQKEKYKIRKIADSKKFVIFKVGNQLIDSGNFKKVKKAFLITEGTNKVIEVACAKLKPRFSSTDHKLFKREFHILDKVATMHPEGTRGLAKYYGTTYWKANKIKDDSDSGQRIGMIFDYYNGGTLTNAFPLSKKEAIVIAKDILYGLSSLHQAGIIHNDLKADNILLKRNEITKEVEGAYIIDFGISCDLNDSNHLKTITISHEVVSPELLKLHREEGACDNLTTQSDIYSLGALFEKWISSSLQDMALNQTIDFALDPNPNNRPSINEFIEILEVIELQNESLEIEFHVTSNNVPTAQTNSGEYEGYDSLIS